MRALNVLVRVAGHKIPDKLAATAKAVAPSDKSHRNDYGICRLSNPVPVFIPGGDM